MRIEWFVIGIFFPSLADGKRQLPQFILREPKLPSHGLWF